MTVGPLERLHSHPASHLRPSVAAMARTPASRAHHGLASRGLPVHYRIPRHHEPRGVRGYEPEIAMIRKSATASCVSAPTVGLHTRAVTASVAGAMRSTIRSSVRSAVVMVTMMLSEATRPVTVKD